MCWSKSRLASQCGPRRRSRRRRSAVGRVAATAEQCRRALGQRTIHWAFNDGLLGAAENVVGRAGGVARSSGSAQLALAH